MNETVELAFEISKLLAHNGYPVDAPAFSVTWGQLAELIAQIVLSHNLAADQLTEETIVDLTNAVRQDLFQMDPKDWHEIVLDRVMTNQAINPALWEPDNEPDEGPLTEQYENATRLGDDDAFWVDAGASADLFEDG
jgi:hypothetical protein